MWGFHQRPLSNTVELTLGLSSLRLNKSLWIRFTCLVCSLLFWFTAIMGSWAELCFKWWQTTWILLVMCFPALGQRCHIAGLLPCENACQLVEAAKERLRGRRYCAEESRSKASNLTVRVELLLPEPWMLESKCFFKTTFLNIWRIADLPRAAS